VNPAMRAISTSRAGKIEVGWNEKRDDLIGSAKIFVSNYGLAQPSKGS